MEDGGVKEEEGAGEEVELAMIPELTVIHRC